jgi:hypothetical protein
VQVFPSSTFRDKNRRDIGNSRSTWTACTMDRDAPPAAHGIAGAGGAVAPTAGCCGDRQRPAVHQRGAVAALARVPAPCRNHASQLSKHVRKSQPRQQDFGVWVVLVAWRWYRNTRAVRELRLHDTHMDLQCRGTAAAALASLPTNKARTAARWSAPSSPVAAAAVAAAAAPTWSPRTTKKLPAPKRNKCVGSISEM